MKKKTVYLVQKVIIEYTEDEHLKEYIDKLKNYPNSYSVGGGYGSFRKSNDKPHVVFENPLKKEKW